MPARYTASFRPISMVRLIGANMNRRTADNVRASGLQIESIEDLRRWGIFKLIVARAGD